MLYEVTTVACPILAVAGASEAAEAWVADPAASGTLLGSWRSEIGLLGQLVILRGFETRDVLAAERSRALRSDRPFNVGRAVSALSMESYAPFPFLPPIETGARGGVFEVRRYRLKPGGLPQTLAGWRDAIAPAKAYTDHLVTAMYGLDGEPRILHLWGFADLAQRSALRAWGYETGVWPPRGGPDAIAEATSAIVLPERFSPLH